MAENRPTALGIEDEAQIRRFLRATLTANGYQLLEATTAQEGLVQVAMRQPEIVILDLGLPDLDGLEVRHITSEQHVVGKQYMQRIESKHIKLRTLVKRLVRRTICFSKTTMHDRVIGLFINR